MSHYKNGSIRGYCIMCKETHNFCCSCIKNNLVSDGLGNNNKKVIIKCCKKCKLYRNYKENWKNKMFLSNKEKIIYPKYIKEVIKMLFLITNRNLNNKTDLIYIPKELWIYIFKKLNNNDIGIKYNYHSFPFCVKCNCFHKYDEAFIKNIDENYNKKEKDIIISYYFLKKNYSLILDNYNIDYECFKLLNYSKSNLKEYLDNYIKDTYTHNNTIGIYSIYENLIKKLLCI